VSHGYGPITDDLYDMFPDRITVEPFVSVDEEGNATYGTPVLNVPARVIGRTRTAAGPDAQEHVSNVQAMLPGEYGFTANDRYTLPVRFSLNPNDPSDLYARQPRAIAVDRSTDEDGAHHQTIYFAVIRARGF